MFVHGLCAGMSQQTQSVKDDRQNWRQRPQMPPFLISATDFYATCRRRRHEFSIASLLFTASSSLR